MKGSDDDVKVLVRCAEVVLVVVKAAIVCVWSVFWF